MLVTDFTTTVLAQRRFERACAIADYVRVHEDGDPLWRFIRGGWTGRRIEDVRIAPNGYELWIKVSAEP